MKAVILAGGLGTRLRVSVSDVPKVMAPINERPFLSLILDQLQNNGVREVVLSIGYLADYIREFYGHRYKNLSIKYIQESQPLGTGGALLNCFKQLALDNYLVLNGDTYLQIDHAHLFDFHRKQEAIMTMTLKHMEDCSRYGAIRVKDSMVVEFLEKSQMGSGLINAGVYVLNSNFFSDYQLEEKFSFESDFVSPNLQQLKPAAYIAEGYFIDIGVPEDYEKAQRELS